MNITNLLGADPTDEVLNLSRSDQMIHDWQALRMVREGYLQTWKLLLTYFSWFCFTLLACAAFALKGELKGNQILVFGIMGDVAVLIQIGMLFIFRSTAGRTRRNVERIIDMGGVINKAYVTPGMIVPKRFADRIIYLMISGMVIAFVLWTFLFFYVLRHPL